MTDFDYPAFLAARLDEQEARVSSPGYCASPDAPVRYLLADIAAKRQAIALTVELRRQAYNGGDSGAVPGYYAASVIVAYLSEPFRDHPDYPGEKAN